MKKSTVIALSVGGSVVLVTCVALSLYFALKKGSQPGPAPLSPKQQCNQNGYIWDSVNQVCTTNQCTATVDSSTGMLTGTMINVTGDACVNVDSGAYISPFARAALLQVCQSAGFQDVSATVAGPQCTKEAGCSSKPYNSDSIMDGCPYLTYQSSSTSADCVPPTDAQLQYFCNTSVNGCPLNTTLNTNCPTDQPCYNLNQGCQSQLATPGCRPPSELWQWINNQCVNTTVSNTIAVTVQSATVDSIQGTYILDNPPQNVESRWLYQLSESDTSQSQPKTWQGPAVVQGSTFSVLLTNLQLPVNSTYAFVLQLYTSTNNSPYVLSFASVTPSAVKLAAAPVVPGLVTIKPALSLALAQQVSTNVPGAILAANNNSGNNNPFVTPSSDTWTNSLPGLTTAGQDFLLVPCTSAYCKTELADGIAMLIMAWPVAALTANQLAEIKKTCPSVADPQVSYAVYLNNTLLQDKLTEGTWLQPVPSDPTIVNTFSIVAYVWSLSGGDTGIEGSSCKSQPYTVVVQAPTNLYSTEICYQIQPLKPTKSPIPGNFMLYLPGANMCTAPKDSVEALGARDFTCLTGVTAPTLTTMQLYGCNDTGDGNSCNFSGQGCESVVPVTSVRQPAAGESVECSPPPPDASPPCGGLQYCQLAACNCPASVQWSKCGSSSYAQVGGENAIEAGRWQSRVNNVHNFIATYGLDKVVDVQTFMNETNSLEDIRATWDKTYGSGVCPITSSWSGPTPGNCDVTSDNACTQFNVCGPWTVDSSGVYKQEVVTYPTAQQQSSCCSTLFTYVNGCCCPSTDKQDSCADLKGCTAVPNALGPTWCTK